ncbi:spermidine synthase [Paracoccus sp. Ld10]|uniref:spermidine synthase n=1 Tax=Paracoccus sp. Ld10 TaxID=649158 RepID=UPI003866D018
MRFYQDGMIGMLPWVQLACAIAPDGDTLRLMRRGDEFSIRLQGGNELMNSRLGGSEEALATLAMDRLGMRPAPQILIGGLGMGFTLRAAQAIAAPQAGLIVAEIVPDLIDWAEHHMAAVFKDCLSDPRVQVRLGDVAAQIRQAAGTFDAILLDVDNGPGGLTRSGNDILYGTAGLQAARRALSPGGVLAVWSAEPDVAFERRLAGCGFDVSTHGVRAAGSGRGSRHVIWVSVRRDD